MRTLKAANAYVAFNRIWLKRLDSKAERQGQAWFNALLEYDVELAECIRGTEFDPYYDDSVIHAANQEVFGTIE